MTLRGISELTGEFTIVYVELPNGRVPAREFVDSLDDKTAARIDAFIERLRIYGNRMQGKFVKKLTDEIFELRVKQFDRIFRVLILLPAGNADRDHVRIPEEDAADSIKRDCQGGAVHEALGELSQSLRWITERDGSHPKGVGAMKRDKHSEIIEQRARKSATYRKTFARTLHRIDLAMLVREMREDSGLTQTELARKVRTSQSVIARLEDAEYTGHSLAMLERIAEVCGVGLKLHAEKKPHFDREVALV
jgi:DNA-binding XRE family transcriptional regulator